MSVTRSYPAKLLLFGEYTVLSGSRALAIPLHRWHGTLEMVASTRDTGILGLSKYITEHQLFPEKQCMAFEAAVQEGLQFISNIPQGYGVGSSGALCAAIYEQFFAQEGEQMDVTKTRQALAAMESYFHGTSSGMDPLVAFMDAPVLRESDRYHILSPLQWPEELKLFLLDSRVTRTTGDLVREYLSWTAQEDFGITCLRPLVQSVDHAISFFIEAYMPMLWKHLKLISALQFQYFTPMIPHAIKQIWESTLDHSDIAIKLCGAGGGGFFLGFAKKHVDVTALTADGILL